jgi:16S rRNA processing protein RimM
LYKPFVSSINGIGVFYNNKRSREYGFSRKFHKTLFLIQYMINKNEWLTVGLITSCHGINGQVKVKSLSDFEERFLKPGIRWLQKENEAPSKIELISGFKQPGKATFILKFQGINTRNHAEQLKKFKILVKADKLPKLQKEEFHLLELVNLEVKTLENNELKKIGKVINLENEKNNLLVVELFKNQKKVLIPFVKEIVPLVDIKNNFLIINPPNGLLEL